MNWPGKLVDSDNDIVLVENSELIHAWLEKAAPTIHEILHDCHEGQAVTATMDVDTDDGIQHVYFVSTIDTTCAYICPKNNGIALQYVFEMVNSKVEELLNSKDLKRTHSEISL